MKIGVAILVFAILAIAIICAMTIPYYEVRVDYVEPATNNQHIAITESPNTKVKFNFWYTGDFKKAYNLEHHKLGSNWQLIFEDERKNLDTIQLETVQLTVDGQPLEVSFRQSAMKFEPNDDFETAAAVQIVFLKKIPKDRFTIKLLGTVRTKSGKELYFSHIETNNIYSKSSFYSQFYLIMPSV